MRIRTLRTRPLLLMTFAALTLLLAPLAVPSGAAGDEIVVIECGEHVHGEVPAGTGIDVGTFDDEEDAFQETEDPEVRAAALETIFFEASNRYRCDVCPAPVLDHCDRELQTGPVDPDDLEFDIVDNGDGTYTARLFVPEDMFAPFDVWCATCPL